MLCSIDDELNKVFMERNEVKAIFLKSNSESDQQIYRKLCNYAAKLNRSKKASFYKKAFRECGNDSKKHGIQLEERSIYHFLRRVEE